MKSARFDYLDPSSLDRAVAPLAEFGEDSNMLAGGQSLVSLMCVSTGHGPSLISTGLRRTDAGLLLLREMDEGLSRLMERHVADLRTGRNWQFPLPDLFRQSIYSRLAGYEDTNESEQLAEDPAFRMLASRKRRETSVALTPTLVDNT